MMRRMGGEKRRGKRKEEKRKIDGHAFSFARIKSAVKHKSQAWEKRRKKKRERKEKRDKIVSRQVFFESREREKKRRIWRRTA